MKYEKGFTLIESLIAIGLLFFVIAMILSGFTNQVTLDRKNDLKNIAVAVAESRLEEYLKLPSDQISLLPTPQVDYFLEGADHRFQPSASAPPTNQPKQMRRTTSYTLLGQMVNINVRVEYFYAAANAAGSRRYIFSVSLSAMKGK